MPVAVTAFYAGLNGSIALMLAFRVVRYRRSRNVGLGDGGHPQLARVQSRAMRDI